MGDGIIHTFQVFGAFTGIVILTLAWLVAIYFIIDEIIGFFVDAPENLEGNEDEDYLA